MRKTYSPVPNIKSGSLSANVADLRRELVNQTGPLPVTISESYAFLSSVGKNEIETFIYLVYQLEKNLLFKLKHRFIVEILLGS